MDISDYIDLTQPENKLKYTNSKLKGMPPRNSMITKKKYINNNVRTSLTATLVEVLFFRVFMTVGCHWKQNECTNRLIPYYGISKSTKQESNQLEK